MAKLTIRIWILIGALLLALLMISHSFKEGVVIKDVEKNSTAFENGLRQGMIITEINSKEIKTIQDYSEVASPLLESNEESRISIVTSEGTFIFLNNNLSDITVSEISNTKVKTGLDLSGGARALVKAANTSLSDSEISDLVSITSQRLNVFGLTDVNVRPVRDISGDNYMLIEIAGASQSDLKSVVGQQGRFEAKI